MRGKLSSFQVTVWTVVNYSEAVVAFGVSAFFFIIF